MPRRAGVRFARNRDGFSVGMLLPTIVVVVLLWLPFGFAMTGLIEEWDLLGLFAMHGTFFYTHLDGPLAPHALRPLMPFSFALAHLLSPDSFAGWHVVTIVALVVKGAAMTWLGWRATGARSAGVLAGVLTLLYPADTMQLSFRSIHINVAGALALGASVFAVRAFDVPRRGATLAWSVGAGLLFLWAGLIYEVAFMLVAMPLAVLVVREGVPRDWNLQRWMAAGCWLAAPLAYAAYAIWVSAQISSYQGTVTGQGSGLRYALSVWPDLFDIGASRALIGGWLDAARMTAGTFQNYAYLAAGAIVLLATCALASIVGRGRLEEGVTQRAASTPIIARLLIAGVILMLMGYLPFMTSAAHMAITQRTYLWATPGAAFVWVAVVMCLVRVAKPIGGMAAATLLLVGLGAQLFQFHHYVELSERQRTLLRAIVENFDGDSPDKKLLVLDGTSQIGHTWMFFEEELRFVLSYLFGRPMGSVEICRVPSMEWHRRNYLGRGGHCVEEDQGWAFIYPPGPVTPGLPSASSKPPLRVDARSIQTVRIDANGKAAARPAMETHRARLRGGEDTISRRYRSILSERPPPLIPPMFKDQFLSPRVRYDFGDWWSLEVVPFGSGWRETDWNGSGMKRTSDSWITGDAATLYIQLAPSAGRYLLNGRFDGFASDKVREGMRVEVNGQEVPLAWTPDGHFGAFVPPGLLRRGRNELEFSPAIDPGFEGLSARVDWLALEPH